jgi:hypothetical protein
MIIREVGLKCGRWIHLTGYGRVSDCCGRGTELSGSINCGEFLKYPSDYQLLVKGPATWN